MADDERYYRQHACSPRLGAYEWRMNMAKQTVHAAPLIMIFLTACASGPPRVEEQPIVALPGEAKQELIDQER